MKKILVILITLALTSCNLFKKAQKVETTTTVATENIATNISAKHFEYSFIDSTTEEFLIVELIPENDSISGMKIFDLNNFKAVNAKVIKNNIKNVSEGSLNGNDSIYSKKINNKDSVQIKKKEPSESDIYNIKNRLNVVDLLMITTILIAFLYIIFFAKD